MSPNSQASCKTSSNAPGMAPRGYLSFVSVSLEDPLISYCPLTCPHAQLLYAGKFKSPIESVWWVSCLHRKGTVVTSSFIMVLALNQVELSQARAFSSSQAECGRLRCT